MIVDLLQPRTPAPAPQPTPAPSREQLQQTIEQTIQAAKDAALEAAKAQGIVVQPPFERFPPPDPGIPENVMIVIIVLGALTAATIIFGPLFRALGRRVDRRGAQSSVDVAGHLAPRLDRIEQAIEAIAVEVERISEGQRYVTKQMHDLRSLPSPNPLGEPALAQRAGEAIRRGESGT